MGQPENSGRDQAGRWRKGTSGNSSGPPRGYRHKATRAAQELLDGQAEQLTQKAVNLALDGDTVALRLCLERLISPQKEAPVVLDLPALISTVDATNAMSKIIADVASGSLTPAEAKSVGQLIETFARVKDVQTLAERLEAVERELRGREHV